MGLTVHFKLAAPADCDTARAKQLVEAMRLVAGHFYMEGLVDRVEPVTSDAKILRQYARNWLIQPVPGRKNAFTEAEVAPAAGFIFCVEVGEDCEPLWLGLCRFPATVIHLGDVLPTKMGAGWRLSGFSKTQYASLRGWGHFQRCHCAVVEILAALRPLGLRVRISDEGDYWPRRSLTRLRRNIEQMNGLVAAAAGALKDGDESGLVKSPIFQHKHFERLEAEGQMKHGISIRQACRLASRLRA
jgi:hypothetical protein